MDHPPPEPTWRLKRGDDWRANPAVTVTDSGAPVDLTAPGWSVRAQIRRAPDLPLLADLDIDTAGLADGQVVLTLTREITATLPAAVLVTDIEVTGPDPATGGPGRRSSLTLGLEVLADVTRDEEPAP